MWTTYVCIRGRTRVWVVHRRCLGYLYTLPRHYHFNPIPRHPNSRRPTPPIHSTASTLTVSTTSINYILLHTNASVCLHKLSVGPTVALHPPQRVLVNLVDHPEKTILQNCMVYMLLHLHVG